MEIIDLALIALAVSMDAFAVSICKGLSLRMVKPSHVLSAGLWFGGFQALMPLIGFFIAGAFSDLIGELDHWIAFLLLGIIGFNMIRESFSADSCGMDGDFSFRRMFPLAVATSIDALAVGASLALLDVNIWVAVAVIGSVTALFSSCGVLIGSVFGCRYKSKAELAGGIILILIGIRILLEHTGILNL